MDCIGRYWVELDTPESWTPIMAPHLLFVGPSMVLKEIKFGTRQSHTASRMSGPQSRLNI